MPDFFYKNGHIHIIRSSPGYDDALVGLSKADKEYLRDGTGSYTVASPERETRIKEAAERKEVNKPFIGRLAHSVAENRFKPRSKRRLY